MDSKAAILKKLITFSDVFLLNNFDISASSLDVIAENKLISFCVSETPESLIFSGNWIIKSNSLSRVELFNVSKSLEVDSSCLLEKAELMQHSLFQLNDLFKKEEADQKQKFVLENLGLVVSTSLYNRNLLCILFRTDKIFKVLVLNLNELEDLINKKQKTFSKSKKILANEFKNGFLENSDEETEEENLMETNKEVEVEKIAKYFKGGELRDVSHILSLGNSFLGVYGKVVKLLDENLKVQRVWLFESQVECLKEIVVASGREVGRLRK